MNVSVSESCTMSLHKTERSFESPRLSERVKLSESDILTDLHDDDDISDGEYSSNCSIGVMVGSDDEFVNDFSDDGEEFKDLYVVGKEAPFEYISSETDMDCNEANRVFMEPISTQKVQNDEQPQARVSSSRTEINKPIQEELKTVKSGGIESEPDLQLCRRHSFKNVMFHNATEKEDTNHSSKPTVRKINVKPLYAVTEMTPPQVQLINEKSENTASVRIANETNSVTSRTNVISSKRPLYGQTIQSTIDAQRSRNQTLSRTIRQRSVSYILQQQLLMADPADEHAKTSHERVTSGIGSSTLVSDEHSGYDTPAQRATHLIHAPLPYNHGNSSAAERRERIRNAVETIDIGRQIEETLLTLNPTLSIKRQRIQHRTVRPIKVESKVQKKSSVIRRIQKQAVRFGRFIRGKIQSLSW